MATPFRPPRRSRARRPHPAPAALAVVAALAVGPAPLAAQRADSLAVGARVRGAVPSAGLTFDGRVVRADSAGLTLPRDDSTATYAWRDVRDLRQHTRRSAGAAFWRGARRGALIAGVLGVVTITPMAVSAGRDRRLAGFGGAVAGAAAVALATVTGTGALAGGVIGLGHRDRWAPVATPVR